MFSSIHRVGEEVLPQVMIDRLCVFGSYNDSELYSRNRTLIDALAACSAEVVEVRPGPTRNSASNHQRLSTIMNLVATAYVVIGNLASLARDFR